MKINIEVEISPEEARRLYGLPDLSEFNGKLAEKIREAITKGDTSALGKVMTPILTSSMQSMENYQKLMWSLFDKAAPGQKEEK